MIRLLPLLILFLYSCSNSEKEPEPETTVPDTTQNETEEKTPRSKVIRKYFDFEYKDTVLTEFPGEKGSRINAKGYFSSNMGMELGPKNRPSSINININKSPKKYLSNNFGYKLFLKTYFGDNIQYLYNMELSDSIPGVWWHCESCDSIILPYLGEIDFGRTFPGREINITFVNGDYQFLLGRRMYRFISFVTYPDEFSLMFCGRFSGGVMGYALFEVNDNTSRLISLDYSVGIYGNYHKPKEPELRIAFGNLFFIYQVTNGGAGGPYTSLNDVFQFDGKNVSKIESQSFLTLFNNGIGDWKTQYQFFQDSITDKVGIKFITTGYFIGNGGNSEDYYPYIYYGAPEEFMKKMRKSEKELSQFTFVYERCFIKKNEKYSKQERIKFKKLVGEWKTVIE